MIERDVAGNTFDDCVIGEQDVSAPDISHDGCGRWWDREVEMTRLPRASMPIYATTREHAARDGSRPANFAIFDIFHTWICSDRTTRPDYHHCLESLNYGTSIARYCGQVSASPHQHERLHRNANRRNQVTFRTNTTSPPVCGSVSFLMAPIVMLATQTFMMLTTAADPSITAACHFLAKQPQQS